MKYGSLFSGIGGIDLGLDRAGMVPAWQVEASKWCRDRLESHWPSLPRFEDVNTVGAAELAQVDLIAGGFPCQDLSVAGKGEGIHAARSGLWWEMLRIVEEVSPRWVLVENPYRSWRRWVPHVRRSLHERGYASVCVRVRAMDVGAPHERARGFVVATPHAFRSHLRDQSWWCRRPNWEGPALTGHDGSQITLADAELIPGGPGLREGEPPAIGRGRSGHGSEQANALPHADGDGCEGGRQPQRAGVESASGTVPDGRRMPGWLGWPGDVGDTDDAGRQEQRRTEPAPPEFQTVERAGWWAAEPDVGRVAHGIPGRVDRLRALGNAVVPQVAEHVGRLIVEANR